MIGLFIMIGLEVKRFGSQLDPESEFHAFGRRELHLFSYLLSLISAYAHDRQTDRRTIVHMMQNYVKKKNVMKYLRKILKYCFHHKQRQRWNNLRLFPKQQNKTRTTDDSLTSCK